MQSFAYPIKRLLINNSKYADFLSASLIIILCLTVLLPKVHDSFHKPDEAIGNQQIELPHNNGDGSLLNQLVTEGQQPEALDQGHINNNNHHHHHHHGLPVGEVLICAGFFVFYCIGLGMGQPDERPAREAEPLLASTRKISTVCCSSTRCPSGQREARSSSPTRLESQDLGSTEDGASSGGGQDDGDCVFALNRHHTHHTHSKHHEHQPAKHLDQPLYQQHHHLDSEPKRRLNYGATSSNHPTVADGNLIANDNLNIYIEEAKTMKQPVDCEKSNCLNWPLSVRYTIFAILLILVLIVFDMNIHGLIESIKVFRAAATGALLYMAFFIILPRDKVGCNSCSKEETIELAS